MTPKHLFIGSIFLFMGGAVTFQVIDLDSVAFANPPTANSTSSAHSAACRAPRTAEKREGERFEYDSPRRQAEDWENWMTEQLNAGRENFIVVPIKKVLKDDGEVQDNPVEVLCAW